LVVEGSPLADHRGQIMKILTSAQLFAAPKRAANADARLERAKLVIVAARERATEKARQCAAQSSHRASEAPLGWELQREALRGAWRAPVAPRVGSIHTPAQGRNILGILCGVLPPSPPAEQASARRRCSVRRLKRAAKLLGISVVTMSAVEKAAAFNLLLAPLYQRKPAIVCTS
jgi:hypothetical protein